MQTSLISPYLRFALINERLWEFELEIDLTPAERDDQNDTFRRDGVELHFYLWPEMAEA